LHHLLCSDSSVEAVVAAAAAGAGVVVADGVGGTGLAAGGSIRGISPSSTGAATAVPVANVVYN